MERLVFPVLTPTAAEVLAPLGARPDLEVIAVAIDVGSGAGLDGLRDMALVAGARRCHVVDMVDALAASVCWPALRAGALAVPGEPVLTALTMPVVAETLARICRDEHATSVGVWADDPADRRRLRALLKTLAPTLGLVSVSGGAGGAVTANVWARVEPADASAPAPRATGHGGAGIRITFERGVPVALSGVTMTPAELIDSLATITRAHGAGTWRMRSAGRDGGTWTVQAPAALALQTAFDALTADRFDPPTREMATTVAEGYAAVLRDGAWFSPVRAGLDAFVDRVLDPVSGEVRLRVVDGRIEVDA
jgi:argininosuccinate synthase